MKELNNVTDEWVIGSPPAVSEGSPFCSKSLQILYRNEMNKNELLEKEDFHKHEDFVDECYIVLKGSLTLRIENCEEILTEKQLIRARAHS